MSSAAGEGTRHPSLPPGTLLGPYAIEAAIGVGGMGEVYRASDTRLDWESGAGQFAVSRAGTLAYLPGGPRPREEFVLSHPEGTLRRQVSSEGGTSPAWSDDGGEIFYVALRERRRPPSVMSVRVLDTTPLRLSAPSLLFEFENAELAFACYSTRCYDVAPNGQGFLAALRAGPSVVAPSVTHINLILNWAEQLEARAPAGQ